MFLAIARSRVLFRPLELQYVRGVVSQFLPFDFAEKHGIRVLHHAATSGFPIISAECVNQ